LKISYKTAPFAEQELCLRPLNTCSGRA